MESSGESPSPRCTHSQLHHRSARHSSSMSQPHVHSIVQSMLKAKTFVGQYKATRRVDSLGDYRDVIEIEKRDPLIPIISELQQRIRHAYPDCWPGFTVPGDLKSQEGHCFWVVHVDKLFELYHYCITDIRFLEKEVCFVIEAVGKVVNEISDSEQTLVETFNTSKEFLQEQSWKLVSNAWQLMTWDNVKNVARFIGVLITILGATAVYLMDFFIRLVHAATGLIKVTMPAILKMLDIYQKVIGALFVFLAMMWKDLFGNRREYHRGYNKKYIKY